MQAKDYRLRVDLQNEYVKSLDGKMNVRFGADNYTMPNAARK